MDLLLNIKWRLIMTNKIIQGDNLEIMRQMADESVDLIVMDPPFNSGKDYKSFDDRWESMPEYLDFMFPRLTECHRLLKDTGSIYLHCDPTASHYLKVLALDMIFGMKNFRNEIVWAYRSGGVSKNWFARKHDVILFYTKSDKNIHTFHVQKERSYSTNSPPGFKGVEKYQDEHGRWYTMASIRDIWDIDIIGRSSSERTNYPTQKPIKLYKRIIAASSNEGDLILDPFCGAGTSADAAQELDRRWIVIDQNPKAAKITEERLRQKYGFTVDFEMEEHHEDSL